MTKYIHKASLFIVFLCLNLTANAQDLLPELKPSALIDDSVVTLGDLFTDLKEKQDIVVANAPEPGQKILISSRHILKVTRQNNVRWRNSAGVKNIAISRMSTIVNIPELKDKLTAELKNLSYTEKNLDIRFYNRNGKIHLPNGYDVADLSVRNISLDRKSDKFSALIGAPTGSGGEKLHTVNGRILRVTMIPTLAKTIRSGEVIKSSDISWTSLPDQQVSRNIVRNKDKLVGMTPRSQIKEGNPIRLNEIERPVLIKRGSLVKIQFNTAKINLSTLGKALEKGGMGDVIQVKNNASNKLISAIVLGPNQVQVNTGASNLVLLNP